MKPVAALSPTQAATRARLVDAVTGLAGERGYDGFTMRDVATAAGVSPATAYLYYSSKDEALVDALVERGIRTSEAAVRRSRRGPRADTVHAFAKVVRAFEQSPLLYQAMFRAYVGCGPEPGDDAGSRWSGNSWLQEVVPDDIASRELVVELLQAQVLTAMITLVTGSPPATVLDRFRRAVDHLLAPTPG